MKHKALITSIATIAILFMLVSTVFFASAVPPVPAFLDSKSIPKYVNQLVAQIPVYVPTQVTDDAGNVIREDYDINMTYFRQQILPAGTPLAPGSDGLTEVWGYQGRVRLNDGSGTIVESFAHSPSASFEATRGIPVQVTWRNNIDVPSIMPVDPTLHWANPNNIVAPPAPYPLFPPGITAAQNSPVPLVPHLHGGEVQSYSDGGPEEWWTWNGLHGADYSTVAPTTSNAAVYNYPNSQEATTLWYHDHALGMTRLNVMSGLAGYYFLREAAATTTITNPTTANFDQYMRQHFPSGVSEIPIAIQDRMFQTNGELYFPAAGDNPTIHPYWMPEFFGNVVMVNGKVWPNLNVTQGWYRFRLLDGSNARFYTLSFSNKMPFTVIGTEGGYLMAPVTANEITIAPGERADIVVDFSNVPVGTKIILKNTAGAPFPANGPADPMTIAQIMQFTVAAASATPGATEPTIPALLNPTLNGTAWPTIPAGTNQRILTLVEVMGPNGPIEALLNGLKWMSATTEFPANGTTEDWIIINLTGDSHPIHTHLTMFQLVSRQRLQGAKYTKDWLAINPAGGMPPFTMDYVPNELNPIPYLLGKASGPLPNEMGWKDTVQMHPGEVTIIRIRYMQQDGGAYPFDPSQGPGYVWHCHIVDHEDNEMMRRYNVVL
jgi:FtsP/CotA-like multicopper oxidase with cupredoxin domain